MTIIWVLYMYMHKLLNGEKIITEKLDKIYLKDEVQTAYLAYERYEKFKRPDTMSIYDYVIDKNLGC